MKILFYSPVQLREGGGCERWHCDITNSLKKQFNDEVEIVTGNIGRSNWSGEYLKKQLSGVPYETINFPKLFGVLIPTPRTVWNLYNKFRSADVIHFIHGFFGQDILVLFLKLFSGKKVVVGHHAPLFHGNKFHNFQMRYFAKYLLNLFDAHMTLNSKDKKFLKNEWGVRKIYFIPSGIRTERFLKIKRRVHLKLNFLTVGTYKPQKGIDLALSAIGMFNKKFPNNKAVFRFAGAGEQKQLIQSYAKRFPNVLDLGYLEYSKLPSIYGQSDIYLLPSREEPFALVLIEAWSSGIPVLATKTEGPLDMLVPHKNGWFIESISDRSIFDSILLIYNNWQNSVDSLLKIEDECRSTGLKYNIDKTATNMNKLLFREK